MWETWTYIVNYEADRFPMGNFEIRIPNWDILGDTDPGPLKAFLVQNREHPEYSRFYELAFGKVKEEELFNHIADPDMIHNLADSPDHLEIKENLRSLLEVYLLETDDPRARGLSPWDDYRLDK